MTFTFENYFQIFIDTCSFSHFFVTGYNRSDPNLKYIIIMMYNTSKMYLVLWTVLLFFFHVKLIFLLGFFINELWRSLKTIFMVITCQTKFHNAVLFSNFTYLLNKAFTYNFYKFERKRTGYFLTLIFITYLCNAYSLAQTIFFLSTPEYIQFFKRPERIKIIYFSVIYHLELFLLGFSFFFFLMKSLESAIKWATAYFTLFVSINFFFTFVTNDFKDVTEQNFVCNALYFFVNFVLSCLVLRLFIKYDKNKENWSIFMKSRYIFNNSMQDRPSVVSLEESKVNLASTQLVLKQLYVIDGSFNLKSKFQNKRKIMVLMVVMIVSSLVELILIGVSNVAICIGAEDPLQRNWSVEVMKRWQFK